MSQHDMDLANQAGAAFRADANLALVALVSNNAGSSAPSTTFAYMYWSDTANDILKQRNAANSAWISICTLSTGEPLNGPTKAAIQSQTYTAFTTGGTSSAFTVTASPALTSYTKARLAVTLNATPTGSPTMNWNGLGAVNFKYYDSAGAKQFVTSAQAVSGQVCDLWHDGTDIILLNPNPPVVTSYTAPVSIVRVKTSNGYGSTNTKIRRYTTTVTSSGSDITYADSATLGGTFTINTTGMYGISCTESFNGGQYLGISLNSTQLTTSIQNITAADRLAASLTVGSNVPGSVATTIYLTAGDVIRAHSDGSGVGVADYVSFTIARIS